MLRLSSTSSPTSKTFCLFFFIFLTLQRSNSFRGIAAKTRVDRFTQTRLHTNKNDRPNIPESLQDNTRNNVQNSFMKLLSLLSVTLSPSIANAKFPSSTTTLSLGSTQAPPAPSTSQTQYKSSPVITDKVYLDIKISNYTEESVGTNRGAQGSGRIVIGLWGKDAPLSTKLFLETVKGDGLVTPSFYNARFSKIVDNCLEIDKIRGLNVVNIGGVEQYEYAGNLLPNYKPILEQSNVRHTKRGLLTRKQLSATPEFGITMDKAEQLDAFHVNFGEVIEGLEVLDAIAEIPTYSYKTKTGYGGKERGVESEVADLWFEGQRSLFVTAGKTFGDTRAVDRRGDLLRRIVIRGAGVL